jgi:hypothetical protein
VPTQAGEAEPDPGLASAGYGFEAFDEAQQLGSLALLELASLQGDQEKSSPFQIVRVEQHFDQTGLRVASSFGASWQFTIEDHGWILRIETPRPTGLMQGLLQ